MVRESTSRSMRSNRAKNTKPELALRRELWRQGVRGYRLHSRLLPGRPDMVFNRQRVAVFVHGCYWHRCPKCKKDAPLKTNVAFWTAKLESNVARDEENIRLLEQLGYRVFVVWECELRADLQSVASALIRTLQTTNRSVYFST